ncbi:MAG: hypothetical protein IH987_08520 [Planctomycetes bacterium]|nr:hypothetical protein [Planctomycetota bacterium]
MTATRRPPQMWSRYSVRLLPVDAACTKLHYHVSNATAQVHLYRWLPACTNRDDDAVKMPAVRVGNDFALSCKRREEDEQK